MIDRNKLHRAEQLIKSAKEIKRLEEIRDAICKNSWMKSGYKINITTPPQYREGYSKETESMDWSSQPYSMVYKFVTQEDFSGSREEQTIIISETGLTAFLEVCVMSINEKINELEKITENE